jgi:FkbM family methyltransferase
LLKPFKAILPGSLTGKFPVVGTIKVGLPDGKSLVIKSDGRDTIASRMYWRGLNGHEPETIALFLVLLSHAKVVFDVGASTGLFTLIAGTTDPNIEVHAFEPVPEMFDSLVRNIAANGLTNVEAVKACITDYDGEIDIYPNQTPALPFQSSIREYYGGHETPRKFRVQALTLDSYADKIGASTVDIIKIDAEVSEPSVLRGAQTILRKYEPLVICEVLYNDTDLMFPGILDEDVYQFFHIKQEGLVKQKEIVGDSSYRYRNYLFVPKSRLDALPDHAIDL